MTAPGPIAIAKALRQQGRERDAVNVIAQGAKGGDPDCMFEAANWRLWGQHGARDLSATHALLKAAGDAGHIDSVLLRATLTANGNGVPADWAGGLALLKSVADAPAAAKQLRLLAAMSLNGDGTPAAAPPAVPISERPRVAQVSGFLTPDECTYLMTSAGWRLEASSIIDPQGRRVPHPIRTSDGASFGPAHADLVVRAIDLRLAALTGTDVRCGEPLHMLRYRPGQQYHPHLDTLYGEDNQRQLTVLLYLNDRFQGGETEFVETGLKIRPPLGDAIVFHDIEPNGQPDKSSKHAGLPVTSGIKWLATRWIRLRPYHPWGLAQA